MRDSQDCDVPDHGAADATRRAGSAKDRSAFAAGDPRPSISVIVTNHNYGHFLDACLDSVLGQSRPAAEIIVVDDHSGDLSMRALERRHGAVTVLEAAARGQAAAFNLGFSRATGDAVLFLDADDLLHVDALETALAYWSDDLALLSFGLEIIDAAGRSAGLHPYSLAADDGDNRPRLIRNRSVSGPFLFAPTSGNLFSRDFLAAALPMPEADWLICADAYLVRAAALWGRSRALERVLGRYRVHGGNNYTRPDTFAPWSMQRSLRDLDISARALEALAAWDSPPATGPDRAALRIALRLRSLETRANAAAWTGDRAAFREQVADAVRATLASAELPFAERVAAAGAMLEFGRRAPPGRPVDPSHEELAVHPRLRRRVPGARQLAARLRALERPRWRPSLAYGVEHVFQNHGRHRNALAEGWCGRRWDGACESSGAEAALEFTLAPTSGPVTAELLLAAPPGFERAGLGVAISVAGARAWVGALAGDGAPTSIRFALDRDPCLPQDPQRIEISCHAIAAGRRLSLARRPDPFMRLFSLRLEEGAASDPDAALRPGAPVALADLVRGAPGSDWLRAPDGSAAMAGEAARLALAFEPGRRRFDLDLALCRDTPEGWLHVRAGDDDLFTGRPYAGSVLRLRLPEIPAHLGGRAIDLDLRFGSDDGEAEERFAVAWARLIDRGEPGATELFGARRPRLNPGQTVLFASNTAARAFLEAGWDGQDAGGAHNVAAEATLGFALADGIRDATLRIRVRPLLSPVADARHVVGVSIGGALVQAVDLQGEGEISVEIGSAATAQGEFELTLHSAHVAADPSASLPSTPALAPLELVSLALDATPPAGAGAETVEVRGPPAETDLLGLTELAGRAVAEMEGADLDALQALRARLAAALAGADGRALETVAAQVGGLDAIEALGAALLAVPLDDGEADIAARAFVAVAIDAPRERLRAHLLSFLLLPAFRSAASLDLARAPALLLRDPAALVRHLGREPEFRDEGDAAVYAIWLETLLADLDGLLRREETGSALHGLALETLRRLRNTKALFTGENLVRQIRLRSMCVETALRQAGCILSTPPPGRRAPGRLRLGVLVRSLQPSPEAWALLGMYGRIDRARFETIAITTDDAETPLATGDRFDREISLAGLAPSEAVAVIRGLDLDAFVLGAHVANWERVTSIVAHRLARVQIVSCFNSPSTLGFESFDAALAWKGAVTEESRRQYTERLVEIAEPLQCCFDFADVAKPPPRAAASVRAEFGLPGRGVLLVSGAMAHKIQPALMEAWAQALARATRARLVLCPFTQWWAMPYAPALFRAQLDARLDAAGVARDRVTVLGRLEPGDYRRLLAACDVYLDSFPYAGGTTVCEALESGLPVVTRRGPMLREQTGAVWAEAFGLGDLIAADAEDYVTIAATIASDAGLRKRMSTRVSDALAAGPAPYSDKARFGAAFSDAVARLCEDAGVVADVEAGRVDEAPAPAEAPPAVASQVGPAPVSSDRVVVLGLGRTGSTLLCNMLRSVVDSCIDFELFHRTEIQYRGGKVLDATAIAERDADPVAWLERYHDDCRLRGYRLLGFKIFAHHDARILEHVAADAQTRIIVIGRRNLLAQYSSQRIAERTGEWATPEGLAPKRAKIVFDPADFEKFERTVAMLEARLRQVLGERRGGVLELDYCDLSSPETLGRLSEHLEREVPVESGYALVKQNPGPIVDRFSKPAIVRAYLKRRGLEAWGDAG